MPVTSAESNGLQAYPDNAPLSHPIDIHEHGALALRNPAGRLPAKRSERLSQLGTEEFGLFPGGEVAAPVDLAEVD